MVDKKYLDGIGKYFLSSGVIFFIQKDVSKAYELIRQGLSVLTCDCLRGGWKKEIDLSLYSFASFANVDINEFNFCKAFLLSYNDDVKSNYVALDSIEQFLNSTEDDSIGWYIKGKILTNLEKFEEALSAYNTSIEFELTSRTLYRKGRLKEQYLKEDGIDDLYSAYMENQSSACCCRVLQEYSFTKGIKIEAEDTNGDNLLIKGFNSHADPWSFQRDFEELLNNRTEVDLYQQTAFEMILGDFVRQLSQSKESFLASEDYEDDYDYDEPDYEPDYDEMYFDAMTDGQLGSYDEFLENGGNLDYIDDWAGR